LSKISQDIQYVKFISSEQRDLDEVVVNVWLNGLEIIYRGSRIFKIKKGCMKKIKFQRYWN
jgi:hypothetical protein